ncbi:MAG: PQQ-dependent sugar dehydrogenase [bacterium]
MCSTFKKWLYCCAIFLSLFATHCSSDNPPLAAGGGGPTTNPPGGSNPPLGGNPPTNPPGPPNTACTGSAVPLSPSTEIASGTHLAFTPVGDSFGTTALIDLDFLPGQNGDALVIAKDGTLFYMKNDFTHLAQTASIASQVENRDEQGFLNVEADPQYASNCYIYLYYTVLGGGLNRVARASVQVDLNTGSFSLSDLQTIIEFPKTGPDNSPSPGTNHNGGSLVFENDENLFIGVGDGGGNSSSDTIENIGQRGNTRLGKIHRIVPNRMAGAGGFFIPVGGNNGGTGVLPEIYSLGVRNPFTLTTASGVLFIGDVGEGNFLRRTDAATSAGLISVGLKRKLDFQPRFRNSHRRIQPHDGARCRGWKTERGSLRRKIDHGGRILPRATLSRIDHEPPDL